MTVEEFIQDFLGVLYVEQGWEDPLTMERLHELLSITLEEIGRRKAA